MLQYLKLLFYLVRLFGIYGVILFIGKAMKKFAPAGIYEYFCSLTWMRCARKLRLQTVSGMSCFLAPGIKAGSKADNIFPGNASLKIAAAEAVCGHVFNFLGTGPVAWRDNIYRHNDIITGFQWPVRFYSSYSPQQIMPGNGTDPKILWELNRFHHLAVLAQAWMLTEKEKYAAECFSQLEHWIKTNKLGYGINWTVCIEAALRAMNWIYALSMLENSSLCTEEAKKTVLTSIRQHAIFIENNLEIGIGKNGQLAAANHFLAAVSALACIGLACPFFPEAARWKKAGLKALETEIQRQVLDDGFYFESSTSYHRFACELFLIPALAARNNGVEMSAAYWRRLEKMLETIMHLATPAGTVPHIGDTDDGRALILSGYPDWPRSDFRYLLAAGAVLFNRPDFKAAAGECSEDVFWLFGEKGAEIFAKMPETAVPASSKALPRAGLYILRSNDGADYCLVRSVANTPHAPRGHAHEDALSIELWINGKPLFIDPGTFCYSSNPQKRRLFRSAAMHNTVEIDGKKAAIAEEGDVFESYENMPKLNALEWNETSDVVFFSAEIVHYFDRQQTVTHRRTISGKKPHSQWRIEDRLAGNGKHNSTWRWHIAASDAPPQISVNGNTCTLIAGSAFPPVIFSSTGNITYNLAPCSHSPSYGITTDALCLTAKSTWKDNCEFVAEIGC